MPDTPVRPVPSPFTPIRPIGPVTPIRRIDPSLLVPKLRLVDLSGATPQANSAVFLSFTSADGSERLARVAIPADGMLSPLSGSETEFLSRVRVFAPPADLVLDVAYPAGYLFVGITTLTVRENPPLLSLRLGTTIPIQLLNRTPLRLMQNPMGVLPQITGLRTGGDPGTPSLPVEVHRILIPPGLQVSSVEPVPDPSPARVAAPVPQIQPPLVIDSPRRRMQSLQTILPVDPPTRGVFPPAPVRLQGVDQHPWGSLATVALSPVQYDAAAREYIHQPNLGYHLQTQPSSTSDRTAAADYLFPEINNGDRANTLLSALNAGNVTAVGAGAGMWLLDPARMISQAPCGMVIITDDTQWTGAAANPPWLDAATPVAGAALAKSAKGNGVIAEFERLAYWKSSRGMRTKVVPISQIVAMHNAGDLKRFQTVPALDLPEIIRSFILYAQKMWQTDYVLLGGSKEIVPMRQVLTPLGPTNWRNGDGATIAVHAFGADSYISKVTGKDGNTLDSCENGAVVNKSMKIMCVSSGTIIPFSKDGKGANGWYFTTAAEFNDAKKVSGYSVLQAQEDTTKPLTVIVFGGKVIDDDYLFLWPNSTSETDYYYSDTTRAAAGRHDWDNNGNLFLAERVPTQLGEACLDSISTTGSVNVGRAPVTNGEEARNFVNKVLAYEQVHAVDAGSIDPYFLARITLLCDNWQHPWTFSQFLRTPDKDHTEPDAAHFMWSGKDAICRLDDTDGLATAMTKTLLSAVPPFKLQSYEEASTVVVDIPYDQTGAADVCWYFCICDYTRVKPSALAVGSPFVRVKNAPVATTLFFWQYKELDAATVQKQRVRALWKNLYPDFGDVRRIYRDNELFPGEPMDPVLQNVVNTMMSQGTHFLSITGHGNVGNVSDLNGGTDAACANAGAPYIAYAHSCLTANPGGYGPASPSLGATLVKQPNGALAYVGYARSCWTGDSVADYETGFWCALQAFRRLGPPVAQRVNNSGWVNYTHIFMMTLYGDPEMPVWTKRPSTLDVSFVYTVVQDGPMKGLESVQITATDGGKPVAGLDVNLLQGWQGSLIDPVWKFYVKTDDNGFAIAWVRSPRKEAMRIVVSSPVKGTDKPLYTPVIKDYTATQKN